MVFLSISAVTLTVRYRSIRLIADALLPGFTSGYMIGLVNKLIAADIAADFYFYANLPAGSVGGTGGGCYELYVDKDKVEEAKVLLKVHFNTKS